MRQRRGRHRVGPGDRRLPRRQQRPCVHRRGGTHLPDLTLVAPIFLGNERRPFAFAANRAHHADIGGMAPGSMALSTEIYQEGFRLPPVHLVRAGKPARDVLELFFANTRVREEREGDLRAQIAALNVGGPLDGTATPTFNPSATGTLGTGVVNALAISGSTLYVGGSFNTIGGQPRDNIAASAWRISSPTRSWRCEGPEAAWSR